VVDQPGTLKRIFDFLEIALPADFQLPTLPLQKQADSLSDLWVEKFNRGDQA
jgi:hypothetical protein